jgi:hypothetical protein
LKEVAIEDLLGRKTGAARLEVIRGCWARGPCLSPVRVVDRFGTSAASARAHGARRIVLIEIDEIALTMTEATCGVTSPISNASVAGGLR